MFTRRILFGAALLAPMLTTYALAAETVPYTQAAFEAALKAEKSILVEVHAPWCPTCKAQAPILKSLESQSKFRDLVVFHVDFDSQADALLRFGVQKQSTLITFKSGKETGRTVGDTNPETIGQLLDRAI